MNRKTASIRQFADFRRQSADVYQRALRPRPEDGYACLQAELSVLNPCLLACSNGWPRTWLRFRRSRRFRTNTGNELSASREYDRWLAFWKYWVEGA